MLKPSSQNQSMKMLAEQVGINLSQLKLGQDLPKWRRLEVLNELKELNEQVQSFNEPNLLR